MTSNQIAAEANAIRKQELEESKRHNIESESIDRDKNRINEAYNTQMADIERQRNALNEELGKLNIEWQSANEARKRQIEERKTDIDAELKNLKQFEANVDAEYKVGLVTTKNLEIGESVRSNKERESIQSKANAIKEREVDINELSEYGLTPTGRAKMMQAAGGIKGPFGLAGLGIFYGTEMTLQASDKIKDALQNRGSSVTTPNEGESAPRSGGSTKIKDSTNWVQGTEMWLPAKDR